MVARSIQGIKMGLIEIYVGFAKLFLISLLVYVMLVTIMAMYAIITNKEFRL